MSAEEVLLGGEKQIEDPENTLYDERLFSLQLLPGDSSQQNVIILSILLALALVTNLSAFPVILFRRTRFGNGQFACLILCLSVSDLLTIICGLLGGLILEVGDMTWLGSGPGCSVYYFITSWLVGLSNYLVVCLVCMILVKRGTGMLARLQECKLLLASLILITILPAVPELLIRSTISDFGPSVCILATQDSLYGLYVVFKLLVRHLLPTILVILCLLKPRTVVAKRISLIFMGEPAVCECGPSGTELSLPHECPKMASNTGLSKPDLLQDMEDQMDSLMTNKTPTENKVEHGKKDIPAMLEDPVRRRYKSILAVTFITTSIIYILVDIIFEIQSAVTASFLTSSSSTLEISSLSESPHEANLSTCLYLFVFLQHIINPVIFIYAEFGVK